jgi:plastocyanin
VSRVGVAAALLGVVLLTPAGAPAHIGHGTPTVTIGALEFSPSSLTIAQNDFVAWTWAGPGNHSVTADPGGGEAFDSDPGTTAARVNHPQGDIFTYYFAKTGTFAYHCKVHPSMRGTIVVTPSTPPSPDAAPRIAGLRAVVGAKRRLRVTFRLSKRAGVTVRVRRAGAKNAVRRAFAFKRRGRGTMVLSLRGLKPGRYALTARAADDADKKSKIARAEFRLKAG